MAGSGESHADKDQHLSEALTALSSPVRIALLRQVRSPKILKEIKLYAPGEDGGAERHQRILARQTVKEHLERLVQIGVVLAREAARDRGTTTEYVVNQQQLFRIAEEFRSLARLRPVPFLEAETVLASQDAPEHKIQGPCMVLVKGIDEGRTFPFPLPDRGGAEWVVGRRRGLPISLEYDPFVSSENTLIRWRDGAWSVEDLPESRNGTTRNFRLLPRGQPTPLRGGDVIGVGRSLLVFYA